MNGCCGPRARRRRAASKMRVSCVHRGRGAYYRATYTAFDGASITPQLIETDDFRHFRISQLAGPAAQNKGMALFPRRVDGRYLALSRWDRENNSIATSPDGVWWGESRTLQTPNRPWELLQIGNCGSPIETEAGWVVLTHGVGPMREYSIGALLLDRTSRAGSSARCVTRCWRPTRTHATAMSPTSSTPAARSGTTISCCCPTVRATRLSDSPWWDCRSSSNG